MRQQLTFQIIFLTISINAYGQLPLKSNLEAASIKIELFETKDNLTFLDSILKDNKVLALGESTHGTSDFFKMKFMIIKYCVTELGYKSIGIEADYAGTKQLNSFLTEGNGNIDDAIYDMGIAAWMTIEMKEIIEWLKDFNSNKSAKDKIQIWGFDMQFSNATVEDLKRIVLPYAKNNEFEIHFFDTIQSWKYSNQINKAKLDGFIKNLKELSKIMNVSDRINLLRLTQILEQTMYFKSKTDYVERLIVRDSCMAFNVNTTLDFYKHKSILWAHNGHIAKSKNYKNWRPMGSYLNKEYGDSYYPLGLMTEKGSIGFYNRLTLMNDTIEIPFDSKKKSYDKILANNSYDNFFIDIKSSLKKPTLKQLFSEKHLTRTIDLIYNTKTKNYYVQNNYFKESLYENFNGIIFIRQTRGARPLKFN
jgi:erythromycin esterase